MIADLIYMALLGIAVPVLAIVVFRKIAKTERRTRRPVQRFNQAVDSRTRR
jgi:hypothetical protein